MTATASLQLSETIEDRFEFDFQSGRDEINLAEFPLWFHGKTPPKNNTLVFTSSVNDSGARRIVQRKMTLRALEEYGLPVERDGSVLMGLFSLAFKANEFKSREFSFTFKELIDFLEWDDSGQNYDRIELAIKRWDSIHIEFDGWYDKANKGWADAPMLCGILGGGKLQPKHRRHLKSQMRWHEDFYKTLQSHNILKLDYKDYNALQMSSAKQAMRFLGKEFGIKPVVNIDLRQFACEHVGLSRSYKPNKLRKILDDIFEELEAIQFIQPAPPEGRYQRVDRSTWNVIIKKPRNKPLTADVRQTELFSDNPLVDILVGRGITKKDARTLVESHTAQEIELQIEFLDFRLQREDEIRSIGGYLRKAIENGHSAPAGYSSKADRKAEAVAIAEAKENRRKSEDNKAKLEEAEKKHHDEKEAAEWELIETYLASLSPSEREECIEQSLGTLLPKMRSKARQYLVDGKDSVYYEVALRNHVLPLLRSEAVV